MAGPLQSYGFSWDMVIVGGKELAADIDALSKRVQKKVVRQAIRAGLGPVQKQAKVNVVAMMGKHTKTGRVSMKGRKGQQSFRRILSKNIVLRAWKKQKPASYGMTVMTKPGVPEFDSESLSVFDYSMKYRARTGKVSRHKHYYIPAAIEYGHDNVPAIPFMRKAIDMKGGPAQRIALQTLRQGVTWERHSSGRVWY